MMMLPVARQSGFVRHIPCPKCKSKDNCALYSDGHEYCFGGCGYYLRAPLTKEKICAILKKPDKTESLTNTVNCAWYADDACLVTAASGSTPEAAPEGLTWLKKYGILGKECSREDILWSEKQRQLIFPLYDGEGNLIAWQARNFDARKNKYQTEGAVGEILHLIGLTNNPEKGIILVEDIVSAIKIGRQHCGMPLFGSSVSLTKLERLRRYAHTIVIWLDADKFGTSMKIAKMASQLNFKTRCIYTPKDPKEYTDAEISQFIG